MKKILSEKETTEKAYIQPSVESNEEIETLY